LALDDVFYFMGIDKTQSAMEILKYFNENADRAEGITISELRKRILPRKGIYKVWLKSKLGLSLVKDIVKIFIDLGYVKTDEPIIVKDRIFNSYRITGKGKLIAIELRKVKNLKDLFAAILYKEVIELR
jgi:hypothetical protein